MPIEIDPNFVRAFADQALVMHLGRDIDVAFLAVGARLEKIQRGRSDSDHDIMNMRPQLNEVARVRLNPNAAAIMAMEVLQGLIRSGVADKQAILSALQDVEEPERQEPAGEIADAHPADKTDPADAA